MATQERYFNPYATTMDEIYTPAKQAQPERSLDELMSELRSFKLTQEYAEFASRFHTLKTEVAEHLATVRSGKTEQLADAHDAAILAARKAKQALGLANQETFKAHQEHAKAQNAHSNADGRVHDLAAAFEKEDSLTRAEKQAWQEKIAAAQAKAGEAYTRLDAAQNAYNACVQHERQLTLAHNEAVRVVTDLAKQIGSLAGTRKSTSGLHTNF
jgi:chromosome segregation ATPase